MCVSILSHHSCIKLSHLISLVGCREHKGHWRASNGYLKTVNKIPSTIGSEEATVLKSMFKGYLKQLCSGCKNTAQLQARYPIIFVFTYWKHYYRVLTLVRRVHVCPCIRMLTSELTGATVLIVESIEPSARHYIGRKGIIISESLNCFHIAYEVSKDDRGVCIDIISGWSVSPWLNGFTL
jgi:hypothetical protein